MFKNALKTAQIGVLTLAVVASQTAIVASTYAADNYLTLSSFSGQPGQSLTVSGGGFQGPGTLSLYTGGVFGSPVTTAAIAENGTFSTNLTIPLNAPQGPLSIIGVDGNNVQASNSYYVVPLQASITVTAASHAPFATVSVNGTGFAANEDVLITLATASVTAHADATGAFTGATLIVPSVTSGLYIVHAAGVASGAVSIDYLNYFWIDGFYPSTTPSAYYLLPGQTLNFTGSGFAPNETISVTANGSDSVLSTFTANATGSFTNAGGFAIPVAFHGTTKTFTLTGSQSHATASTGMTVGDFYAYASPSVYWLLPTQSLSFNGGGFAGNETVSVYRGLETTPITTLTTSADGSFMNLGSVNVPADAANGSISFRLVGNASGAATSPVTVSVGSFYPSISPSDYYVQPNATITITGSGFAPNETVSVFTKGDQAVTTTANAFGAISTQVLIPYNPTGSASIGATGSISKASAFVDVTLATFYPSISPSAYYVFPGDQVSFTGTGFAPNENITVVVGTSVTHTTTNNFGTFTTAPLTIPLNASKTLAFSFLGSVSNTTVTSNLTIGALFPYLTSDVYSSVPGQTINISGFRFGANETVNVKAGSFTTTTVADANGNIAPVAITVPFGAGSSLKVVFTGASTGASSSLDIALGAFYPSITSDNYYAAPGSTVHLNFSGYAPNEIITITADAVAVASTTTNSFGIASNVAVTLPYTSLSGTGIVLSAVGNTSGVSSGLTITLAPFSTLVTPSTYYTAAGSTVTFTGSGFAANEAMTVTVDGAPASPFTANATGAFTHNITIPLSSKGTAHFVFTGGTTHAVANVDVSLAAFYSSITLSTYYAQAGSPLTITGSGFGNGEQVGLMMGSTAIGTTTANTSGAITYTGTVPFAPSGDKTITATGASTGTIATSPITIAPTYTSLQLGSYAGAPGSAITLIGAGYLANEPLSLTTDRTGSSVYTFNADASGNFTNSGFIIPADLAEGNLVLTVTSGHSFTSHSITYYVTGK